LTGYDFFSNVPVNIQAVIEARVDSGQLTPPATVQKKQAVKVH